MTNTTAVRALRAVPAVQPEPGEDPWVEHLRSLLKPGWRTAEWKADKLEFQGDPANVLTKVYACPVPGCTTLAISENGLCEPCGKAFNKVRAQMTREQFIAARRPHPTRHADWGRFSLAEAPAPVAVELLWVLQRRDEEGIVLSPERVRAVLRKLPPTTESLLHLEEEFVESLSAANAGFVRTARIELRRQRQAFDGSDPTAPDVWDCALVGLKAGRGRAYTAVTGIVDFTKIRQPWLRELVKQYGRDTRPAVIELRQVVWAAELASDALTRRTNGNSPSRLGMADMTVIHHAIMNATGEDGVEYSLTYRRGLFGFWRRMIDYCRQAGLMDEIPGGFAINPQIHATPRDVPIDEEEPGRAVPEHIIRQLDQHLDLMGTHSAYTNGDWTAADFATMYRVYYQVLRDTGRRPGEVASLKRTYLEYPDGKPVLVYDNHKRRRYGRRLPINQSTADIIEEWLRVLATLPPVAGCGQWMFPQPGGRNRRRRTHMNPQNFRAHVLTAWLDMLPDLLDEGLDETGQPRVYDKGEITLYGFRHAYAQRHADAGTAVDVLKELMDHRSVDTTMGYYRVSLDRKRDAINTIARMVFDRHGSPLGFDDPVAYERETVTVPFGGCSEPSNVAAGGGHCPLRFQCPGCSFYRPDPSYLPAIDQHVAELRSDRETALATDAADWVVDNLNSEISAFVGVSDLMQHKLAELPEEEREAVEEAARQLRKARQAAAFIPLTALGRREQ